MMSQQSSYQIELINPEDIDETLNFLKRTFYKDEPLNKTVGLSSNTEQTLDRYCMKGLVQGISFKAVDGEGNIIGCLVNSIKELEEEHGENLILKRAEMCEDEKFKKILYIVGTRSQANLKQKFPNVDRLFEIMVASTDPAWRKQGVMKNLMKESEQKAKELGINMLIMETSSCYSARTAESADFTCVYQRLYADIKLNGQPLIVPEEPHIYDKVYVKNI